LKDHKEVENIIETNKEKVEKIAKLLIEKEVIHEEELIKII